MKGKPERSGCKDGERRVGLVGELKGGYSAAFTGDDSCWGCAGFSQDKTDFVVNLARDRGFTRFLGNSVDLVVYVQCW